MSWQSTVVNISMRLSKWYLSGKDFSRAQAIMKKMSDGPAENAAPPLTANIEKTIIANVNCEWVRDNEVPADCHNIIVYFHGGGFFFGSPATHRDVAHKLSAAANMKCLVVDYSLTPDHIFPTALNEACAVYQWLLDNGYRANDIAFGGDSAGGNMTIATMKLLQQRQQPLPFAGFCVSACPWV